MEYNKDRITKLFIKKTDDTYFDGGNEEEDNGGFKCIPKKQKPTKNPDGDKLRNMLLAFFLFHLVCIFLEIFMYNLLISMIFTEAFYAWLAYFCFMTMMSTAIYIYIGLLFLAAGLGILNIFAVGGWFLIYIA